MNVRTGGPGGDYAISELLTVARQTIAQVSNCWLITGALGGGSSARVVTPLANSIPDGDWSACFVTSLGSRKVGEIRQDDRVTLGFQHDPDGAYVALVGRATVIDDRERIAAHWQASWSKVFMAGPGDPDAGFIEMTTERIELFSLARRVAPRRSASARRRWCGCSREPGGWPSGARRGRRPCVVVFATRLRPDSS